MLQRELGIWRIEERIWQGGTATIYKAISEKDNQVFAIKILHSYRNEVHHVKRFIKEYKILKRLSHPGIIKVYRFGVYDKLYYIVMEFVNGRNLRFIKDNNISSYQLLSIFVKIGKVLEYLYEKKVIHNDIKPENILVSNDFKNVKIIDFGYAEKFSIFKRKIKYAGGTEKYIAPERKNGFLSLKGDIFSFGVMMEEFFQKFEIFQELYPTILRATHPDPEKRIEIKDLVRKLEEFL